ncbi:MAG: hypothetical protein ABIR51_09080 [Sphingomicrobium sp.]
MARQLASTVVVSFARRLGVALLAGASRPTEDAIMAKGQKKSNKEARKPKSEKKKTIAANPSTKGNVQGLENFKN